MYIIINVVYVNGTLINYLHAVIIFENNIFEFLIMRLVAPGTTGDDGIIIYNICFNNVYILLYTRRCGVSEINGCTKYFSGTIFNLEHAKNFFLFKYYVHFS